ncbi:uncharacterized protein LOC111049391 isoform X1 [Nilaparvata lugens]|uniref:uncharacterized protein LOC111049391 isoform X1 n=1 Tax=Nilaparvata lugens TaxID=108931 RepID=UPI00193E2962|nr:uncharacterized protein LOC111049391 isoform X1 [Nilaparvata lugens]XP_039289154.1 uncharacterized protein LOC111049391 isoform X1 [Nilaparvata lugens]
MDSMKRLFVIFLMLSYGTLYTSQNTPDSNESDEDSAEAITKTPSEQDMNLKLLETIEREQIGNLTGRLIEQFIDKVTDEINSIEKELHDHRRNLLHSGWELLARRLAGTVFLLEQSSCSEKLGKKVKNVLLEGRGYIRNCAANHDVMRGFKDWVRFTLEMLQDLQNKFKTDVEQCRNKNQKRSVEDCFVRLFHYNENRKIQFRRDIFQRFKESAHTANDNLEENWFKCTVRCMGAAKKTNDILEKMIKLQLTESDTFSDCDMFSGVISPAFKIRPHESGLEPYFREIKGASLIRLEDPYHVFMTDF